MGIGNVKVKLKIDDLLLPQLNQIKEYRAKQCGELTPKELIKVILNELLSDDVEDLFMVRINKNGQVVSGWSFTDAVKALGALEIAKKHVIEEIE